MLRPMSWAARARARRRTLPPALLTVLVPAAGATGAGADGAEWVHPGSIDGLPNPPDVAAATPGVGPVAALLSALTIVGHVLSRTVGLPPSWRITSAWRASPPASPR
jgi:hypothetical protein